MPKFRVSLTERRVYDVVVEAVDVRAVQEFSWNNHDMLRTLVEPNVSQDQSAVIVELKPDTTLKTHVYLNALQAVQDV